MKTLTRKDQVIEVLQAGGTIRLCHPARGLLELRDASGQDIPAWQQAMQAATRHFKGTRRHAGVSACD